MLLNLVSVIFYIQRLGLEVERVAVRQVAINEYHKIPEIINGFVEEIIEMGPNPFKGF
jgi:quinone-modifying oxidoreductase subunit QmoB